MSVSAEKYTKNVYQIKIPLKYIRENWRFVVVVHFFHTKNMQFHRNSKIKRNCLYNNEDCKAFLIINKPITGWNTNITKNNTDHCKNDAKKKCVWVDGFAQIYEQTKPNSKLHTHAHTLQNDESMQAENETIANQTMNTIMNNTHLYKLQKCFS